MSSTDRPICVLFNWYKKVAKFRRALSNGCDSPHWHGTLHGCNLCVHTILALCHTGAIRLVLMVLSDYIAYMPDMNFTCVHYIIDMSYDQNMFVLNLIGAFCPIRSGTPHIYNFFITQNGCQ